MSIQPINSSSSSSIAAPATPSEPPLFSAADLALPVAELNLADRQITPIIRYEAASESASSSSKPRLAMDYKAWKEIMGVEPVGAEPPLPADIHATLASPCPYFPDKTVGETHFLLCMPREVIKEGETVKLTLKTLGEIAQSAPNNSVGYNLWFDDRGFTSWLETIGNTPVEQPYWVLVTKNGIPESGDLPLEEKQSVLQANYRISRGLETTAAIFLEFKRSGIWPFRHSERPGIVCQDEAPFHDYSDLGKIGLRFLLRQINRAASRWVGVENALPDLVPPHSSRLMVCPQPASWWYTSDSIFKPGVGLFNTHPSWCYSRIAAARPCTNLPAIEPSSSEHRITIRPESES